MENNHIQINHLTIGYKEKGNRKVVATDINACLHSGELTCLLGANGIGKSTLLRTLSGFQAPLEGEIILRGKPLSTYSDKELATLIGVVLTEKCELRNMTVEELVGMGILKHVSYRYQVGDRVGGLDEQEAYLLTHARSGVLLVDELRLDKEVRRRKIDISETLHNMEKRGAARCIETRYDFKNAKISTGLNGINRIFLPTSKIYPTLVASDTNDFVSNVEIKADTEAGWKSAFMEKVFRPGKFRKISKSEACRIQGFPPDFKLPESRPRWMKLIGNSVAVPVVRMLAGAVVSTGVFDEADWNGKPVAPCGLFTDADFCG